MNDIKVHIWARDASGQLFEWSGKPSAWPGTATVEAFAVCPRLGEDSPSQPPYGPVITVKPKG